MVEFDKKFKTILRHRIPSPPTDMFDWLHKNSIGEVLIKDDLHDYLVYMYIAFENEDDAIVFRIKYGM